MNIGLMAMIPLSLLPVGLMQTWASVEHGYWYARSSEFLQTDLMSRLRWMRMFGDTIFAVGAITFVLFVFGLSSGHSYTPAGAKGLTPIRRARPSPCPPRRPRVVRRTRIRSIGSWSAAS
jgi:nitric oxide reductase subunit B